jgi:hypothetical protein
MYIVNHRNINAGSGRLMKQEPAEVTQEVFA